MNNLQVTIAAPATRPVFAAEVALLLEILPPELVNAIATLGCDEPETAEQAEQRD
jgi:hypothetical protein